MPEYRGKLICKYYSVVEVQRLIDNAVAVAIAQTRESMIKEELVRLEKEIFDFKN